MKNVVRARGNNSLPTKSTLSTNSPASSPSPSPSPSPAPTPSPAPVADLLGTSVSPSPSPILSGGVADLLGGGSPAPVLKPVSSELPTVLRPNDENANGLQVDAAFAVVGGVVVLNVCFTNLSSGPASGFMMKFNKNAYLPVFNNTRPLFHSQLLVGPHWPSLCPESGTR